ncbi:hypothetical protein J7F03_11840 [Streptomyces sp. ISL-43]|uniref:hypothetical protein n=1 Tax=Streptomyces sp. ISL-43 TaxID=2819183 RepID=UPI001BE6B7E2|nr:hypothetical protein [Streptomyces sp. ISL-43]MBT2447753.1 hypothetical protein [Streptomyces sp. ISL-43]
MAAVTAAVLVLALCSALTVAGLRARFPVPPASGVHATGAPLLGVNGDPWTATLPRLGQKPPAALMRDALGCAPLFGWATEARAVPRGQVTVAYAVGASPSRAAVVRGIRVVKGPRLPAPRGDDVGCASNGGDERQGALTMADDKPVLPVRLSLDAEAPRENAVLPVRAGGSATGMVSVTTADCTCAWWLELDVEEDGGRTTVRVDDDGRPFALAPPATPLATSADEALNVPRPLSRAFGDPRPTRAGVSVAAVLVPRRESWEVESDRPQDPAKDVGGEATLGGVACRRMYASVLRGGGVPAGEHELQLEISGPAGTEGAVLDAAVRLESVREDAGQRYRYSCAPSGVDAHAGYDRPDIVRNLYPDTLHALGPFPSGSLRYDPYWTPEQGVGKTMPLAVDEEFTLSRAELSGGPGAAGISAVIGPEQVTFGFTVEVTITLPTGERAEFKLSDHGQPFLLGPGTGKLNALHQEDHHEPLSGPHYDYEAPADQ